ncbi:MAG: polyphosphate kinase 1 [Caldilineaceae bacterium]|nr:polyphosphate kinase 1 [Caldilineaceae bacterium]
MHSLSGVSEGQRLPAAPTADRANAQSIEASPPIIQPATQVYVPDVDLSSLSLDELSTSEIVYNRELSWLDFNWRVLNEALDARNPLLERLKFIAITASNLDEFFRKRVGGLKRQKAAGIAHLTLPGLTPDHQLQLISKAVRPMIEAQTDCLSQELLPKLAEQGLRIFKYAELNFDQQQWLRAYYLREVYPILTPLAVDPGHPFPFLSNLSLSLGVFLRDPVTDETQFARVKVPQNRSRWVHLENPSHMVPLEEVMIHNLDTLFTGMDILAAYPFRITRNADIARNEEEADDLLDMISEELREQRFAEVVRLEIDAAMPPAMSAILQHELNLEQNDIYPVDGLLRLADLFPLAEANLPHLKYEPWTPMTHPRLVGIDRQSRTGDLFSIIRQGDLLVHHPYHSFSASTQLFIEAAARDPHVVAIKQTLYRTSADSPVVSALTQAAERGKQVAVLVEVKARFDEAQNIEWARALENAGCHVAYGLVGLKTHSKLSLVIRDEEDGLRAYFHIGTGNYNPKTASLYTDIGLFSCNPEIGADIMDVFNFLTGYSRQTQYRKLLVAPVNMRQRFAELIDIEISHALNGRPAHLIAKMNGLEDQVLIRKLYEASQAGVSVDLIVRGNCRLRPGLPGISENIRVISMIGRFLEHSRIFYFANGGEPRYFIGSADWMRRNLSNRVEAIVPIEDSRLQEQLAHILHISLEDERQTWEMLPDGRYRQRRPRPDDTSSPAALGTQAWLMRQIRHAASQVTDEE